MGIGCYAGCGRDVVGQCQGHTRRCGRFYCLAHGLDRLCEACAGDLDCDSEAEQRYGAYQDAAREIVAARQSGRAWRNATLVAAVLLTAVLVAQVAGAARSVASGGVRFLVTAALLAGAAGSVLMARRARWREEDLRARYGEEPGFRQFLPLWERHARDRSGDERDVQRNRARQVDLIASALRRRPLAEVRPALELEPD